MNRRVVVPVLALVLGAAGCAPMQGERVSAAIEVPSASGAVRVASADRLHGRPNAVAVDANGAVVTAGSHTVAALDRNGRVLWSVPLDGAGSGPPVLVGDRVIVPVAASNGEGGCVGLDRKTGATSWSYLWPRAHGVVAGRAAPETVLCVLSDGIAVELSLELGFEVWGCTYEDGPKPGTVADRTAFALADATHLFAVPARVRGRFRVFLQRAGTGEWRAHLDFVSEGTPSSPVNLGHGQIAFAMSHGELVVVATASGRLKWVHLPGAHGFTPASVPTIAGRILLIADRAGRVFAVDLATRRVRWTADAPGPLTTAPIVVGQAVILLTGTGRLQGFGLGDGAPVRLPETPGRVTVAAGEPGGASAVLAGPDPAGGWIARWVAPPEHGPRAPEPQSAS